MGAKLREKDGFYWVVVHHQGRRKWKKIGQDKREAQRVVKKIEAMLALGEFVMDRERQSPTIQEALERWYEDYRATFSPSFAEAAKLNIERHLIPSLGTIQLRDLSERDLLRFVREKTDPMLVKKPLRASTVLNILSLVKASILLLIPFLNLQHTNQHNQIRLFMISQIPTPPPISPTHARNIRIISVKSKSFPFNQHISFQPPF